MNIGKLLGILTPFANNKQLLVDDQDTDDIISHILKAHKKYASDYDKISDYFWKGNAVDTSHFVFDFLKKNVVYSIEPESRQSVKSPAAILSTGAYKSGGNDCKHYSLFQAGIYDSLRRKGKKIPPLRCSPPLSTILHLPPHSQVLKSDSPGGTIQNKKEEK